MCKDEELLHQCYEVMYGYMIDKNIRGLSGMIDDSFVLFHMTGMQQSKKEYLDSIQNGTLNYYSASHESIEAIVQGKKATLTGKSKVLAAVLGGGKNFWRLQLKIEFIKAENGWLMTQIRASTY